MNGVRETLVRLREQAGISQAELAKRLTNASASRISRIESGELGLSTEDAEQIADALGTSLAAAKEFADYLRETWNVVERPAFNHVSRAALRKAEVAMQQLVGLERDPELRNAFLQQIKSCKAALERAIAFLLATEHPIAFIGSPGVGKTTIICALARLRNVLEKELNRQMALQTGSGRTTVCEVHVRYGSAYSIAVDPCSADELYQHVSEFCDHLITLATERRDSSEGPGISSEVERSLRNMTGLAERKTKQADGKYKREDPALELARQHPSKQDLQVQVHSRLDADRRKRTSISFPRDSTFSGLEWLSKTLGDINYGRHPEFSLPRRIEVSVPAPILDSTDLDITLIDTRGVDEPFAPRRDLQAYLDDPRALVVFCSGFKDAPDAAMQALIERATQGGLRGALANRSLLLVLPQDGEEAAVRDNATGEPVSSVAEGREIRRDQAAMTLRHIGDQLDIEFLNVRSEADCAALQAILLNRLVGMRQEYEQQIDSLVSTVDRFITNRANEQMRATFQAATRPLRIWFTQNSELGSLQKDVDIALLEEIEGIRYASTLRASVNRRGTWHNFDYWHGLGFGARREVVARTGDKITLLYGLIDIALADNDVREAHDFLRHFRKQIETAIVSLYQEVQSVGETAFFEQLREDQIYWDRCRGRWGGGQGYKSDIRGWTDEWFDRSVREERHQFVEQEVQRRWRGLMAALDAQLSSAEPGEDVAAA